MIYITKPRIYLETTVYNYFFSESVDNVQDNIDTIELFKQIKQGNFDAFYSDVVIIEIDQCYEPKRSKMLNLIQEYELQKVSIDTGYEKLAELFISEGAIPERKRNDALHIAIATVNNLDIVVSWNCDHIVKFKTKKSLIL